MKEKKTSSISTAKPGVQVNDTVEFVNGERLIVADVVKKAYYWEVHWRTTPWLKVRNMVARRIKSLRHPC